LAANPRRRCWASPSVPNSHRIAPPNTAQLSARHHGLTQHFHQRAQHHPQLPECHKHPAAIWRSIAVAYIRTMGCLRCDCPTCQRVPERGRERERLEGSEHRRYVESVLRRSIATHEAEAPRDMFLPWTCPVSPSSITGAGPAQVRPQHTAAVPKQLQLQLHRGSAICNKEFY